MNRTPASSSPRQPRALMAEVDGQLGRVGARDQVGGAHQVDEPLVGQPLPALDQLLAHHRGVRGRPTEGHHAQPEEDEGDLSGRAESRSRSRSGHDCILPPIRVAGITTRVAGSRHAWNQPHPGRGRHPRLPPGRHVVLHRPGPHDRRHHLRLDHDDRLHLPRARRGDLRRPRRRDRPRDHAQRRARRRLGVRRQPDRADRPGRRQHPGRQGRLHLLPHRRGAAPLRGPGRRPGLPLLAVRGAGRPPRLHHLRAARPQGAVHVHRHRAGRLEGVLQRRDARAGGSVRRTGSAARRSGGSPRPSRCRPTSPRWSPASTTRSTRPTPARTARSRWASTAASRWSSTSTPTSC